MPIYEFSCDCGTRFERFLLYRDSDVPQICECGAKATKQISVPMMIRASPDVHYHSPIDGKLITSFKAHREDMARHDCIPYDPEMKTDYRRRIERGEKALDLAVERTVEESIEKMPSAKKESLAGELRSGVTTEIVRSSVDG